VGGGGEGGVSKSNRSEMATSMSKRISKFI
jgi:hypothetical protein